MRPKLTRLALAALLTLCTAIGQVPQAYPLESLRVSGNDQFPAERILAATALKIGQSVVKADFDRARDRLIATGAFEKVGYEYKPSAAQTGYDAVFEVVETTPLYAYRFEELAAPEATLRNTLRQLEPLYDDRIPATPQVLNRFSEALGKSLGAAVIGDINSDTPEPMILFRPLGERLNISEVNFKGVKALDEGDLMRAISGPAIGTSYSEPLFRQVLDAALRPIYEDKGRIRVSFPAIETARSTENQGLVVTVTIDEGAIYRLGKVEYTGVDRQRIAALQKLADLRFDEPADFSAINAALGRIRKSFREEGYLRVSTTVERRIQETEHILNLAVAIDPGDRYSMGKLTINGLDILSEPVIRKMWQLQPGAPYRESYADDLLARIQAEGIFDNLDRTGAEAVIHDDTRTVDVTLTFQGARPNPQQQRRR